MQPRETDSLIDSLASTFEGWTAEECLGAMREQAGMPDPEAQGWEEMGRGMRRAVLIAAGLSPSRASWPWGRIRPEDRQGCRVALQRMEAAAATIRRRMRGVAALAGRQMERAA